MVLLKMSARADLVRHSGKPSLSRSIDQRKRWYESDGIQGRKFVNRQGYLALRQNPRVTYGNVDSNPTYPPWILT
jgi:hypothetical protein